VRYLAVLMPGMAIPLELRRIVEVQLVEASNWRMVHDTLGLLILADRPVLPVGSGAVLGDLYERGGRTAARAVDAPEQTAIAATRGQRLTDLYWGSYVAFLPAPADPRIDVVRAPFGDLGCLVVETRGATLIASDMASLMTLVDAKPAVDWRQVARHLVLGDAEPGTTCLDGIGALRGGERLTVTDRREPAILWSPWSHVASSPVTDRHEAATRLRDTVRMSVRARLSSFSRPLLMLSGGLDSTILASCLAAEGKPFTCLNLVSGDASGEPLHRIRAIARSIAQLAEVAELTVLRRAAHRAWFRRDAFRAVGDTSLLTPSAVAATEPVCTHPWLADGRGKAPGKAAYVALLAIAQAWVEGQDAARSPLTLSPLVAQPVLELGLRIPSWFWFEEGSNRAVARAAFADVLPPAIHARQSKATPDSFVLDLFERNRGPIRELLCDGLLAGQGMIELPQIERILADPRPASGRSPQRIMRLVDVETWARAWTPRSAG